MDRFKMSRVNRDKVSVPEEPPGSPTGTTYVERLLAVDIDPQTCYEVFFSHWKQTLQVFNKHTATAVFKRSRVSMDEVQTVVNYMNQMMCLLVEEKSPSGGVIGRMLELMIRDNMLDKFFVWCSKSGEFFEDLKYEQLKIYEILIAQSRQSVLMHNAILNPLLRLLLACSEFNSERVESRLILLLNQLCVALSKDTTLLEFLFHASPNQGPAKFLIFSLLIPFVHREGRRGQQARDALLLCMAVSSEAETVGKYIAGSTSLCPVLATGLGALYSRLPRKLVIDVDHWHSLTREDWVKIPELVHFLNSLEFCNAVVQVSHPLVSDQLVQFFHDGFLVPVIGPALHQISVEETIAATAYVELFIRSITEPSLMRVFLRFLCTAKHENKFILDSLISRIGSNSRLCLVTLSLFYTLLDINCEDVMLQLILRYLVPCTHLMVSQRKSVKDVDLDGRCASKFLSLSPDCCQSKVKPLNGIDKKLQSKPVTKETCDEPVNDPDLTNNSVLLTKKSEVVLGGSPQFSKRLFGQRRHSDSRSSGGSSSLNQSINGLDDILDETLSDFVTSHNEYLQDASDGIYNCVLGCSSWSAPYDGENPRPFTHSHDTDSVSSSEGRPFHTSRSNSPMERSSSFVRTPESNRKGSLSSLSSSFSESLNRSVPFGSGFEGNASPRLPRGSDPIVQDTIQEILQFETGSGSSGENQVIELADLNSSIEEVLNYERGISDERNSFGSFYSDSSHLKVNRSKNLATDKKKGSRLSKENKYSQSNGTSHADSVINSTSRKASGSPISSPRSQVKRSNTFEGFSSKYDQNQDGSSLSKWLTALGEDGSSEHLHLGDDEKKDALERTLSRNESMNASDDVQVFWNYDSDFDTSKTYRQRSFSGDTSNEAEKILTALGFNTKKDQETSPKTGRTKRGTLSSMSSFSESDWEFDGRSSPLQNGVNSPQHSQRRKLPNIPMHSSPQPKKVLHVNGNLLDDLDFENELGKPQQSTLDSIIPHLAPGSVISGPLLPTPLIQQVMFSPIKNNPMTPTTGPFITAIFNKLDTMMTNSLYVNLLVTGIITRLAYYPQPLIRSFVLNTNIVMQPSIRSMIQVLSSVRNKLDSYASTIDNFEYLLLRAKRYLFAREEQAFSTHRGREFSLREDHFREEHTRKSATLDSPINKSPRKVSIGDIFRRGKRNKSVKASEKQKLKAIQDMEKNKQETKDPKYETLRTKNAVYCAVVFEEFLKELSAICHEHAVFNMEAMTLKLPL
ncbi:FTS and Hook-interacting protein-like isoform X2 [Anneissia japonica]|uniref:FTS and Hook-interacting protein-like isoform X2 n=1 Tax=Anneissia japonica TaxID=1529436 RepID=UPI0014258445|nr:FTS and Hook-interacting protein-like isoform X2 [Anneissia japonica]